MRAWTILLSALIAGGLTAACSGESGGSYVPWSGFKDSNTSDTQPSDPPPDSTGADGGSTVSDGGTTTHGDGGTTTSTNAFTGAGAFSSQLGLSSIVSSHPFPNNNPANQVCVTCHSGFLAGGTIYLDSAGTQPAAGVEVRLRDAAGRAVSAYTDQAGNFFVRKNASNGVTLPALVGVRNASNTALMAGTITNGMCAASGCHVSGKQGFVHLP